MPHVTCPGCGRLINLLPSEMALTVECARCNTRFCPEPAVPKVTDDAPIGYTWTPKPRSPYPTWLIGAFVAAPVIIGTAILVLFAFGTAQPKKPTPLAQKPAPQPEMPAPRRPEREQPAPIPKEERPPPPQQPAPEPKRPPQATPTPRPMPAKPDFPKPTSAELAILERINRHREIAGVAQVTIDPALSHGCAAHAQYLLQNAFVPRLAVYDEDPELPNFSESGWKTAKMAHVYVWSGKPPAGWPATAVDYWMATFYQRVPFLNPDLEAVGVGFVSGERGDAGFLVVDCKSRVKPGGIVTATTFPADKQRDIPCFFGMGTSEIPSPVPGRDNQAGVGFPVTVTFWNAGRVQNVRAALRDPAQKKVPVWLSAPEYPSPAAHLQQNTVCLIPQKPLKLGPVYTVEVSATVDGMDWKRTWSFTTAR